MDHGDCWYEKCLKGKYRTNRDEKAVERVCDVAMEAVFLREYQGEWAWMGEGVRSTV